MEAAIFLDRDGVLIQNRPGYVRRWQDVKVYPNAVRALVAAKSSPYKLVIITNQSAVGRGLMSLETANAINNQLAAELRQRGGRIDAVFMCPHAPEQHCACRKPKPGLLYQAERLLGIDLQKSLLIGDAVTDLQAGREAGLAKVALVRTGRGRSQAVLARTDGAPVFQDLAHALRTFVNPRPSQPAHATTRAEHQT